MKLDSTVMMWKKVYSPTRACSRHWMDVSAVLSPR